MFYGMSSDHLDHHLHQLVASRTSPSLQPVNIPLSFPSDLQDNHNPSSFSASGFDPCPPAEFGSKLILQQLHQNHQESHSPAGITKSYVGGKNNALISGSDSLSLQREKSVVPWFDEEVHALFKFRSSMEVSLPEFTRGHVSRKLAEIGFKRSVDDGCKEKFQEGKHFTSTIISYNELDEFYPHDHQEETQVSTERQLFRNVETKNRVDHPESEHNNVDATSGIKEATKTCTQENEEVERRRRAKAIKKRKREDKMERLRDYFVAIVDKVMAQQEELHNKLIEGIIKRDEEKIAREEAWKIQELNRSRIEIETRVKDQASAEERHATIIEFLKKFTQEERHGIEKKVQVHVNPTPLTGDQSPTADHANSNYDKGGGKRWPRDEVLALINLRCNSNANGGDHSSDKELGQKGPLWERISQGMMELGYKRSAKRCKEKWENINKYFRKTRDGTKKRSVDSRTCPYFHQLSCLYSGRTTPTGEEEQPQPHAS